MAGDFTKIQEKEQSPFVKVFNCPRCGSSVKISALGMSIMVVCSSCGTTFDTTNENMVVLDKLKQSLFSKPVIQIGSRGKLHGTLWEVIGYVERSDTYSYHWSEYLLFNPQKGFRWLSENSGHWSWIVSTKDTPKDFTAFATYRNKSYRLFHTGKAEITYIMGEFYWRASVGDKTRVKDFISAPEILSVDYTQTEKNWSLGQYIEPETIRKAFNLETMPLTQGVAPNQPWKAQKDHTDIKWIWAMMMGLLILLQLYRASSSENKKVFDFNGSYQSNLGGPLRPLVTPSFELKDKSGNLKLYLNTQISNQWLELQVELVNDDTGESKEYEFGVEFYSGYDGGESWSEGDRATTYLIRGVPAGNYHLNVTPIAEGVYPIDFELSGRRDVIIYSDFFWAMFWISIIPFFMALRSYSFERKRWENSDYSPYHGAESE